MKQLIDKNFKPNGPWLLFDQFQAFINEQPDLLIEGPSTEVEAAAKTIIIAISPRVGSTALCSALVNAGLSKRIEEWLNPRGPFQAEFKGHPAISIDSYISGLIKHYSSKGLLVFKSTWTDFAPLVENDLVDQLFPDRQFIFIERVNKAAQAVSLYRAISSDKWHVRVNDEKPKDATEFKIDLLAHHYQTVLGENDNWKNYLLKDSSRVVRITYESFESDIMEGVNQIFDFLSYERPRHGQAAYQKISDAVSLDWSFKLDQYMHGNYAPALNLTHQPEQSKLVLEKMVSDIYRSKIYQTLNKIINFWRIQKQQRLMRKNKIWVPKLFNARFYLNQYPEVKTSKMHPYVHFQLFGWYQGYQPMPLFDVKWYTTQYPDFYQENMNPLEHYESVGQHIGHRPCVLFDPQWYLAEYPDVKQAGVDPLYHYCYTGWREGRNPSPEFDSVRYFESEPEIAEKDINPLIHYLRGKGN